MRYSTPPATAKLGPALLVLPVMGMAALNVVPVLEVLIVRLLFGPV